MGDDGSINNWLNIVLINRTIKVVAEGIQSEEVKTDVGVPQA